MTTKVIKEDEKVKDDELVEELVVGVGADIQVKATEIIKAEVKSGAVSADTKDKIGSLGVPFSKLNKLCNAILQAEGLAIDIKSLTANIDKKLKACKFTGEESWDKLKEISDAMVEVEPNVTQARVFARIKNIFDGMDSKVPSKPHTKRGRMGYINKTIIDLFKKNPKTSVTELAAALEPQCKSKATATSYAKQYHPSCYAIANSLSALEAQTVFAKGE